MRTLEETFRLCLLQINSEARQHGLSAAVLARSYFSDQPRVIYQKDIYHDGDLMPDDPEAVALKARLTAWLQNANHVTTERGYKTLLSAEKGHQEIHGSKEEKAAKWDAYQKLVNELRHRHPSKSWADIKRYVAKHFVVSEKTIQRHTHDPTPK